MIWQARTRFADASGRTGTSDWRIEAFDADQARAMLATALGRSGRRLMSADIDADTTGASGPVSLVTALQEGPVHWQDSTGSDAIDLTVAPETRPPGLPDWLPAPLWHALFAPRDGARVYAVLDPALWPAQGMDLAADLRASGLPAASLFLAADDSDIAATAPWIVDLTLPAGPPPATAPTALHGRIAATYLARPAGVFLRAPVPLATVRAGLRKLTKVQDLDGKWYFNRFWEPEFFIYFISFLTGRRLLAPIWHITGFAAVAGDGLIASACDLTSCATAPHDRQTDLDLLFDAGTAMVALRHARTLEATHQREIDPEEVFALARAHLLRDGMDYTRVMQAIDMAYTLIAFYGDRAGEALHRALLTRLFDDDGDCRLDFEMFHGHVVFALGQNIAPHRLRNTYWS